MNWLTFTASIINSLAWPTAIVVIICVMREPLSGLLNKLTGLKAAGIEAQFGKEVAQAKDEIRTGGVVSASPALAQNEKATLEQRFRLLAEASPQGAVIEAWAPFETAALEATLALGMGYIRGVLQAVDALVDAGMLTKEEADIVFRFRKLRNAVVHARTLDLPEETVADYAIVLAGIKSALNQRVAARTGRSISQ
jgi:hypothetical protein